MSFISNVGLRSDREVRAAGKWFHPPKAVILFPTVFNIYTLVHPNARVMSETCFDKTLISNVP